MKCEIYRRAGVCIATFFALMVIGFTGLFSKPVAEASRSASRGDGNTSRNRLVASYGKLPLSFEANTGQTNREVEFLSRGSGYTLFLTRQAETVLVVNSSADKRTSGNSTGALDAKAKSQPENTIPSVFRMKLVNAQVDSRAEGLEELSGKANYFIGNDAKKWRRNVPLFGRVKYRDVYPGVDLVYYGNQRQLEHDFIVAPGADPNSIALDFEGAEKLSLNAQGDLVLAAKGGEVRLQKPRIYQNVDGARREIPGNYAIKNAHEAGFEIAAYDPGRTLIIDPVLSYSTYLGGSGDSAGGDTASGIAVDSGGNAYVTGYTFSADFPTTSGAFQTTGPTTCSFAGGCPYTEAFVSKLSPDGSRLVYSTFLGGSDERNYAYAIAVDSAGDAYVTGETCSSEFPTTAGAFQATLHGSVGRGNGNAFITKLNPDGSALVYSTYLGGGGGYGNNTGWACQAGDQGSAIAVDPSGNAYVAGRSESFDFPTTPGSFQTAHNGSLGGNDTFITKINPRGSRLVYSTYLGGSGYDQATGIVVGHGGSVYVTGFTSSTDFPTTSGAFQPSAGQGYKAFVTKLNPSGSAPIYSTYLGGTTSIYPWYQGSSDSAAAMAVDNAGNAYVAGSSQSIDFPTTVGAYQSLPRGGGDAFVTKLSPDGATLVYSTYVGGNSSDGVAGIAVDASGNAFLTGTTASSDFPLTTNAIQPVLAGQSDAFVLVLNPKGAGLIYSSYLGGSNYEQGAGIALDSSDGAYIVGYTGSNDFPTTPGALQRTFRGTTANGSNAFVTKFSGF